MSAENMNLISIDNREEVSSLNPQLHLLRVIRIVPEDENEECMSKLQLLQEETLALCNELVPTCASISQGDLPQVRINFHALNETCMPTIGFYGDKKMMLQIFRNDECLVGSSDLSLMEAGNFEAGLYVGVRAQGILVFYWHQGEFFKQDDDLSCNFIRYLVELCDHVHVCVEGIYDYPFESLAASAIRSAESSDNLVGLLPELNARIDGEVEEFFPGSAVISYSVKNVLFCQGYHGCQFVTPRYRTPFVSKRTEIEAVEAYKVGDLIERWSLDSNIDYSHLSNEDFVFLLKCCQLPEYDNYCNLKDSFKTRTAHSRTAMRSAKLDELKRCIMKVLPEFCSNIFLLLPDLSSADDVGDGGRKTDDTFAQLHRELSMILTGKKGDQRVLFAGSEVKFKCEDTQEEHVFTIGWPSERKSRPYITYEQEVNIKYSSGDKPDVKAKFLPLRELKDLILSGEKLILSINQSGSTEMEGILEIVDDGSCSSAVGRWVEDMVPTKLKSLEKSIGFIGFLSSRGIDVQPITLKLITQHLTIQNIQSLPSAIQSLFNQFQNDGLQFTLDQEACNKLLSDQHVRKVMSRQVCKRKQEFLKNVITNSIKKDLWNVVEKQLDEEKLENIKQFEQKKNEFLTGLKEKMSGKGNDILVTRYAKQNRRKFLSACLEKLKYMFLVDRVEFKVSVQEDYKPAIVWKAWTLELKLDKRGRRVNVQATCLPSYELVGVSPECERLLYIVLLSSMDSLIFVENFKDCCLYVYLCPWTGLNINIRHDPIHSFPRGFDLLSFDECGRSVALYDRQNFKVGIYRFDYSFRKVYPTGVDVDLRACQEGSGIIKWMNFIPGKMELLLVDDTNKVRVLEINSETPTIKPKQISLPSPLSTACISADGLFFLVLAQGPSSNAPPSLEIYVLGDDMSFLKSINLNVGVCDLEHVEMKIASFETQTYLVLYSPTDAPRSISFTALKIHLAKEAAQLKQILKVQDETIAGSCPCLQYLSHVFDKFATTPVLFAEEKRDILFNVLLEGSHSPESCREETCMKYLRALLLQLKAAKDKDFSNTKVRFHVEIFQKWATEGLAVFSASGGSKKKEMGIWIRKLVSLVPLQIAFPRNNGMVALKDGLQIPTHMAYTDSVSLAYLISFGLYDAVLNSWQGKVRVISSIGKEGSGKSYLLNHLSGSLFYLSDSKYNNGVWMTTRAGEECMYVLLELKGLGSVGRKEQEDVLLSLFNAAISNLTIFNKKECCLDRETEMIFNRFHKASSLVKQDRKLFKGLLCIAVKDIDRPDVEDLRQEFHNQITQFCTKSEENFISKMYDGNVEIAALAPYNRGQYYQQSLNEIAEIVDDRIALYENGFTFLRDLKLVIAQIVAKEWVPIDSKRAATIVYILRRSLKSAIHTGCVSMTDNLQMLVKFDTQEEVQDLPIVVGNIPFDTRDSGLCLAPTDDTRTTTDVLSELIPILEKVLPRKGNDANYWHSMYKDFLGALADRRCRRVQQWLDSNTRDVYAHEEVQRLLLEANMSLEALKQGLSICGSKCSVCFWGCMLETGHSSDHSCVGSHQCTEDVSVRESTRGGGGGGGKVEVIDDKPVEEVCTYKTGHLGPHGDPEKNDTCKKACYWSEKSWKCEKFCYLELDHPGQHVCNSPLHLCMTKCSHPRCQNLCYIGIESDHEKHQCYETKCQGKCIIEGCNMRCGVEDHFHDVDPNAEHLCGNEHACSHKCGMRGICEVATELIRPTNEFRGIRRSFQFEQKAEQRPVRLKCCVPIPPFKTNHEGPHVHTEKVDAVHRCEVMCPPCGYFCENAVDHSGLHQTSHGNMRNAKFVSDSEVIPLQDREYTWGETGAAEMCIIFCKKQHMEGRGHIHLIACPGDSSCTGKLYDGCRHETTQYGPDKDVSKDEMTHQAYWKYIGFVDPYTAEEQRPFGLCNHYCSKKHASGEPSLCTEKLWHAPIQRPRRRNMTSAGYVSTDGHRFDCDHSKEVSHCHVIFIVDRSGSMNEQDEQPPSGSKFKSSHNNRLGCAYHAILEFIEKRLEMFAEDTISIILFDHEASAPIRMQEIDENIIYPYVLLQHHARGGTDYTCGLREAEKIMMAATNDTTTGMKEPVVIFLSDGGHWSPAGDPVVVVDTMKRREPRMKLHTVMFGGDRTTGILIQMANAGGGEFRNSHHLADLVKGFEDIATSLKPQVISISNA